MMTMDPKDQEPKLNPSGDWEQDLEMIRSELPDLDSIEPPNLLDQSVLNSARRELAASRRKPIRWIGAFATAAVMVLAISIVVQQDQKTPEPDIGNGFRLDSSRPAAAKKEKPVGSTSVAELPAASPPPPDAVTSEVLNRAEPQRVESKRLKDSAKQVSAPSALMGDHTTETALMKVNEEIDSLAADETGLTESREKFEDDKFDMPVVSSEDSDMFRERDSESESNFIPAHSSLPEKAEVASDEGVLAPTAWIEYMLELKESGRYQDLKTELVAFRKAYPSASLPAELKD